MTESTKTAKENLQELTEKFTELSEKADERRKSAGKTFDYYKFEYADGERHANAEAAKKLNSIISAM